MIRQTAFGIALLTLMVSGYFLYGAYRESLLVPELPINEVKPKAAEKEAIPHGKNANAKADVQEGVIVLDEFFVNLTSERESERTFSLGLRLELSLFEDADSAHIQKDLSGIRNTIIEVAREQDYYHLKTTAGKLYFKEVLAQRINAFLNASWIRDVRFAALLFQK